MSQLFLSPSLLVVIAVLSRDSFIFTYPLNFADYLLDNANPDSDENRSLRKYAHLLRAVPNVTAEFNTIVCLFSKSDRQS